MKMSIKPKLIVRDFNTLKEVLTATSNFISDDITLKFEPQSIRIQECDRSMVSYLDIKVSAGYFDEFEIEPSDKSKLKGPNSISFNLEGLLEILKSLDKNSKIKIETIENKLSITEDSEFSTNMTLDLIDREKSEEPIKIETMAWDSEFTIKSNIFAKMIDKMAKLKSDSVIIEAGENITFTDQKGHKLTLNVGDDTILEYNKKPAKSRFSLDYLKKFAKFCKTFDNVKVNLKTDFPLKLGFQSDNITIIGILAPRVEEA